MASSDGPGDGPDAAPLGDGTPATDPAADPRAQYDYAFDDVERPGLVADLEARVDGEVRFDAYSRSLYATDASAYQMTPIGVVHPVDTADVAAVMSYCAEQSVPVLPRGGGTSLAGQSVNEAVVLDFTRHMDAVRQVDPASATATAQAGVYLGRLNEACAPHDLKFAPDPAWGDKSALGGAIGNNSTGAHSLKYGKTDAYIERVEAVLADGTVVEFGEIGLDELRTKADPDADAWGPEGPPSPLLPAIYGELARIIDEEATEVARRYPDLKRNVSGYNLDVLVEEARAAAAGERDGVNLARVLAGSEGTLAIVTEATVSLEPVPSTKAVALLTYDGLLDAMEDVAPILEHDPAAVEVMDEVLLDLARDTAEFADVVGLLPEGTDATLLVEFYAADDDAGREKVADLVADRVIDPDRVDTAVAAPGRVTTGHERYARDAMEAHDADTRAKFWKMRKAGLPILLSRTSDAKHISFIEDTAVPAEALPGFIADFREVLEANDTFAAYYAHAGPGVLHIRPLIDTKTDAGIDQMAAIADAVTDLVVEYGGSVSGEHGDGRARTQWNRKLYGERLWRVFRDLKRAFDPDWLLNPGTVCGDHDMTEHLRFSPAYEFTTGFDPALEWDNENGFQGMAELCHGCGGCRGHQDVTGGVMCPTYRAMDEEGLSTRGRANALRNAMSGDLPADPFGEEFVTEVMDLCIGCKGCAKDCPSEVDLAKLKAEVEHEHHQREGASLRDRLFANVATINKVGAALAPLSNLATRLPGSGWLAERLLGIAKERDLPAFHRETFRDWFADAGPLGPPPEQATRTALLFPDAYTTYNDPAIPRAAAEVLAAAGVHVAMPDTGPSGRAAHSKGFLDLARERVATNVDALAPRVEAGWDVVVVEPSDAVMFQSDALDLLSGPDVETVADNTYGVCEYLDTFRLDEGLFDAGAPETEARTETGTGTETHLTYHGHCHQKATLKDHHAVGVLRRAGFEVDPLDSTCCGMAGSFGYEAEHYSMSRAIGDILHDQVRTSGGRPVAPGASCRAQLESYDETPVHPIVLLADALQPEAAAAAGADSGATAESAGMTPDPAAADD